MKKTNTEILEKQFRSLKLSNRHDDRRNAAEHAYALAVIFKNQGKMQKARQFAKASIDLFDENQGKNPNDYAPQNVAIGDVPMPSSYIHSGVIKDRLKALF